MKTYDITIKITVGTLTDENISSGLCKAATDAAHDIAASLLTLDEGENHRYGRRRSDAAVRLDSVEVVQAG